MAIPLPKPTQVSSASTQAVSNKTLPKETGRRPQEPTSCQLPKQLSPVLLSEDDPGDGFRTAWSPSRAAWSSSLPAWFNLMGRLDPRCDAKRFRWTVDENPKKIAEQAATEIGPWFDGGNQQHSFDGTQQSSLLRLEHLLSRMEAFASFCRTHLREGTIAGYQLTISDLQGDHCTQCPAFHVDHVPCRCVETLHGPGTLYLDPSHHHNDYQNNDTLRRLIWNDRPPHLTWDWKEELLHQSSAAQEQPVVVSQASIGHPCLLIGHRWKDLAKPKHRSRSVVLHRSPRDVAQDQARIVLVLDVETTTGLCDDGCCH